MRGDVVQISPEYDQKFGGCFLLVTEPKVFGAQGFVQIPASGQAFYRCKFENMEYIGKAEWAPDEKRAK